MNITLIETALYIHIPFCDHKCIYCDFYSIITSENVLNYLKALKQEISFYSNNQENRSITSIFFGGGTPSLMDPWYLKEIIDHIKNCFSVSPIAEITMETNPGTVTLGKLKEFHSSGINRISIGIQSFDNEELKFLTRIHDSEKAVETVNNASTAGFKNISIDLIFNLPGQTKDKWLYNLNKAVTLPINHISTYSLILERGTILNKMVLDKKVELQDDDYDADLYETTIDFLEDHGFSQYEVSNFAKNGAECLHNKAYWEYKDYFGFGTSAHSFVNRKRWWNFRSAKMYIESVKKLSSAVASSEYITEEQSLEEYIMLALRSKGINMKQTRELFGSDWEKRNKVYLNTMVKNGFIKADKDILSLSKTGYAVCDEILLNLK